MDQKALFGNLVTFIAAVIEAKHEFTKDIRIEGITPVQYSMLEYLAAHRSGPVTISEMSDCQHMSLPNTSRELRKLSEKGLCEKFADPEDKRKQYIRLSPKGQAQMDEVFQVVYGKFLQRVQGLTDKDYEEVVLAIHLLKDKVF